MSEWAGVALTLMRTVVIPSVDRSIGRGIGNGVAGITRRHGRDVEALSWVVAIHMHARASLTVRGFSSSGMRSRSNRGRHRGESAHRVIAAARGLLLYGRTYAISGPRGIGGSRLGVVVSGRVEVRPPTIAAHSPAVIIGGGYRALGEWSAA